MFNRNNVIISFSYLPNFKWMINGHINNILIEQEMSFSCNFRDKASCPLKGSWQHKHSVYSCKLLTTDLKQKHPHHIGLTEHTFKDRRNRIF